MKQFFAMLFNAILWVVILLLVFLVSSGAYQHFFSKDGNTGFFGIGYAVVVSGSMEPNIQINDMILYQEHDKEDYEVGDVVVYERENANGESMLITHRIKEINEDTLVTRGDANQVDDAPIAWDSVVGRVAVRIPKLGKVVQFVRTPAGFLACVAAILVLIVVNILLTGNRNSERRMRRNEEMYEDEKPENPDDSGSPQVMV